VQHWLAIIIFSIGLAVPALAQPPSFSASSVLNGASLTTGPLAPGEQVIISGSNLGGATTTACIANGVAPTSCASVSVLVNGQAAPLLSVAAGQISFQMPFGIAGTSATLQVVRQVGGQTFQSAAVPVSLAPTAPGLYAPSQNYCIMLGNFVHASGVPVTPFNPVQPGETIILYATGFGATNPVIASGISPGVNAQLVAPITIYVGGVVMGATYAGLAPGQIGVDQVNFVVLPPFGFAGGNLPVVANVGGVDSPAALLPVAPYGTQQGQTPVIQAIVNGASLTAGPIAPGELAAINGDNLGGTATTCSGATGGLPTSCSGTSVLVNGNPAPLYLTSSTQTTFQVPTDTSGACATIQVVRQTAGQTLQSVVANWPVAPTAPGLFSLNGGSAGIGLFSNSSGASITASNPARPGDALTGYGTGFGATNPIVASGSPAPAGAPAVAAPITVTVGGQSALVQSAVLEPGSIGVDEVVFNVPNGPSVGNLPVVVNVGGIDSPPVMLPVLGVAISGVSNNASGAAGLESGSWVSIYGTNLSATTRAWQSSDFVGDNLPTALAGVSVTIDGKSAAVSYVSPGQLNVQAPSDATTGSVPVLVTNAYGSASSVGSLQQYAPGFFALNGKYVAAVHADGTYVAPLGFFGSAASSTPAQPGEIIMLYGTGFGPTTPAVPAGQIVSGAAPLTDLTQLQIRIGPVAVTVQFAGIVAAGEYQFNVVVPSLPNGDTPIVADIAGVSTQSGLLIAIGN
jgi:uncharacterized protein (TIGR03437 family)